MIEATKSTNCAILTSYEEGSFSDIDEQAAQLPGYDQRYQQLSAGHYEGVFCTIEAINGFSIYIEETNQVLGQQGCVPEDSFALGILLQTDTPCMFDGVPLQPNDIFLQSPGVEYDFRTSVGMQICIVNIPATYLEDSISDTDQLPKAPIIGGDTRLVESISMFVKASVDRFRRDPSILSRPGAIAAFQSTVTSMISWYLTLAMEVESPPTPDRRRQDLILFRKARDLMHADLRANQSVNEICSQIGISRRTLENSFSSICGIGPAKYFKTAKMNDIRRELLRSDFESLRIGDIAAQWNVWNLGRFAGEYYALFGERPSHTRNRM